MVDIRLVDFMMLPALCAGATAGVVMIAGGAAIHRAAVDRAAAGTLAVSARPTGAPGVAAAAAPAGSAPATSLRLDGFSLRVTPIRQAGHSPAPGPVPRHPA